MSNKLFVGNLSFNTTENDLSDAFAAHGTVTETNLMMDRTTNRPRGFGFVTMSSAARSPKDDHRRVERQELDGRASRSMSPNRAKSVPAAVVVVVNSASAAAVAIVTKRLIFAAGFG